MGCLYKLDFPNGKSYIGITSYCLETRLKGHIKNSKQKKKSAVGLAIAKYGKSFIANTLVIGAMEYLRELEVKAIKAYVTKAPNGYNVTDGGDGVIGYQFTDEARMKLSKALTGIKRPPMSLEQRAILSEKSKGNTSHKGFKHSEEIRKKMGLGAKNNIGIKRSPETILKMKEASKRRANTPEGKAQMHNIVKISAEVRKMRKLNDTSKN